MSNMRVWHMPQVGSCMVTYYVPVETLEEGKRVMDLLSCYDLFQLENKIKPDFCNTNGLEVYNEDDNVWEGWYLDSEEKSFDNIDDYFENNEEMKNYTKALFKQLKGNF